MGWFWDVFPWWLLRVTTLFSQNWLLVCLLTNCPLNSVARFQVGLIIILLVRFLQFFTHQSLYTKFSTSIPCQMQSLFYIQLLPFWWLSFLWVISSCLGAFQCVGFCFVFWVFLVLCISALCRLFFKDRKCCWRLTWSTMRKLLYHQSSKQVTCLSQLSKNHPPRYTVLGVVARTFHSGT